MRPERRTDDLFVRELDGEVLVYDDRTGKAHSLNATAAQVFHLCDGTQSLDDLAAAVATEQRVGLNDAAAMVDLALEQLSQRGLLTADITRASGDRRMTRRGLIRNLAIAMVAIPVIVSLAAPAPVAASSLQSDNSGCTSNDQCQSGLCLGGRCSETGRQTGFVCTSGLQCKSGVCNAGACT